MIFQIENKNVHTSDAGQGIDSKKDTIIFLHGSGLSHIVWSLAEQFFSNKNFNVLSIDLPGHGNSDGPCLDTIEKIADWLESIFVKLNLDKVILIGHSQGCLEAIEYSFKYKKRLKKIEPEFKKSSTLFHSKEEVEGLYQSLSKYAGVNGLTISKIQKKKPKPVLKAGVAQQAEELMKKTDVSYYKIPVEYEIKGNFLGYIKFKRSISRSNKMLNFDKETISIVQNNSTGAIIAQGELTIVGIPDEFF